MKPINLGDAHEKFKNYLKANKHSNSTIIAYGKDIDQLATFLDELKKNQVHEVTKDDISAFLGIYLEKSSLYDDVIKRLNLIPEVVKIHYTTGNYNVFIKLHCKDTNHLKDVLHDKIQQIEGIERTETIISLEESLNRHIQFTDK